MPKNRNPRYTGQDSKTVSPIVLVFVAVMALLVALSIGLRIIINSNDLEEIEPRLSETTPAETEAERSFWDRLFGEKETLPPETEPPIEPEHVVSRASISVTGDILMHMPVIRTGLQGDGSYNFDSIFRYLSAYSSSSDLAIANLETTLCGTDGGYKYSGYPAFNCPDAIVDSLRNAGFDVLLTANNHCYDTGEYGFLRTVKTIRQKGLTALGTAESIDDPIYFIADLNGIKVGLVCFTYEAPPENASVNTVYMNQNALSSNCSVLINSFLPTQLDPFYLKARMIDQDMRQAGADATVMFIHWGDEYQTTPSTAQNNIAQQLCDLGYDVIVGGHPHVIQPVELLTSRLNPEHKTVCLYSTGNAVSNQRISEMNLKTGHTEDALLFTMTFSKYSDDTVWLEDVSLLPCWVDLRVREPREYIITPLDPQTKNDWKTIYQMTDEAYSNAVKSYYRTLDLTNSGMEQAKQYLSAQKEQREAAYLAAVTQMTDAA